MQQLKIKKISNENWKKSYLFHVFLTTILAVCYNEDITVQEGKAAVL